MNATMPVFMWSLGKGSPVLFGDVDPIHVVVVLVAVQTRGAAVAFQHLAAVSAHIFME